MDRITNGLGIAERVAWEFIKGLGVDPDRLDHRTLGTPAELLERQPQLGLVFVDDFPVESTRYYEARLDMERPLRPFDTARDHTLISYEVADHRYPIAFMYKDVVRYGERQRERWINFELMQRRHTTALHQQVLSAMATYDILSGRNTCDASIFLPVERDVLMRPLFPGVYQPDTSYSRALLTSAMSFMKRDDRVPDDLSVLVLGSGSGVDEVKFVTELGVNVDCVDINHCAVANTRANALLAGVEGMVNAWQSDGLEAVDGRYDYILFNAPLAVKRESDRINLHDTGGRLLRRVLSSVPDHLCEGGRLLLMSHKDISGYLPSVLSAQRVFDFARVPLAIHSIGVK